MPETKRQYWSKLIAKQEARRQKLRPFCRERGIGEHSFYQWRKRLSGNPTVRFALLETRMASAETPTALELVLSRGERLRIGAGGMRQRYDWCWIPCGNDPPAGLRASVSMPGAD